MCVSAKNWRFYRHRSSLIRCCDTQFSLQYFPSIEYLVEVLQAALKTLATGGFIFVGDVRSLPLLETFYTATIFERASDSLNLEEFRKKVQNAVNQEEELVIAPAFFLALKEYFPAITSVNLVVIRMS